MKTNKKELTKQEEFIRNDKRHHYQISSYRTIIFLIFLGIWELSADLGWIDSFFFSSPSKVFLCFIGLLKDHTLFMHVGITLWETILSFVLVFLISLLISTLLWYSDKLSEVLEPYLVILNSLPKSALAPLFIVWLGTVTQTIIVAVISVAFF